MQDVKNDYLQAHQRLKEKKNYLHTRAHLLEAIRSWFKKKKFLEITTPFVLAHSSLEPLVPQAGINFFNHSNKRFSGWLRSSPEFALKKALSGNVSNRVYEIAPCFRNHELLDQVNLSAQQDNHNHIHHSSEFTMLEWYRTNADYTHLMGDVKSLLLHIAHRMKHKKFFSANKTMLCYQQHQANLKQHRHISVTEAFQRYANIPEQVLMSPSRMVGIAVERNYLPSLYKKKILQQKDNLTAIDIIASDAFYAIFLNEVEKHLLQISCKHPVVLYDYPCYQSAYAKQKKTASGKKYAERFEIYLMGCELANGYSELTDESEHRKRLLQNKMYLEKTTDKQFSVDEYFLSALNTLTSSNKQMAGIALGIDRLAMIFANALSIEKVMLFTTAEVFNKNNK